MGKIFLLPEGLYFQTSSLVKGCSVLLSVCYTTACKEQRNLLGVNLVRSYSKLQCVLTWNADGVQPESCVEKALNFFSASHCCNICGQTMSFSERNWLVEPTCLEAQLTAQFHLFRKNQPSCTQYHPEHSHQIRFLAHSWHISSVF